MQTMVDVDWVQDRLGEIVLLDATLPPVGVVPVVDTRARYRAQHLPGAIFFDIEALSDPDTTLPHMLPTPERFAKQMSALGVPFTGKTLVVYEQFGVFSAPRAWWMLRTLGAADVCVLDGGLTAWKAAGLPVEAGEVSLPPAEFHASLHTEDVADLQDLRDALDRGEQVVDARGAARFRGEAPEPRPNLSSGHMPGATSVPFTELVADGRMKSAEDIAAVYRARGIDLDRPVMTTCGSGVTAAVLALGLQLSGANQVRLYDGSWAEYAAQPNAAIVTGE